MNALDLIIAAFCYLVGCAFGMVLSAGVWLRLQPAGTSFATWWKARFPSNVISLAIAGLGMGVWLDGTLVAWLHLGEYASVTPAISLVVGGIMVFFARRIVAWSERWTKAKIGGDGDEADV